MPNNNIIEDHNIDVDTLIKDIQKVIRICPHGCIHDQIIPYSQNSIAEISKIREHILRLSNNITNINNVVSGIYEEQPSGNLVSIRQSDRIEHLTKVRRKMRTMIEILLELTGDIKDFHLLARDIIFDKLPHVRKQKGNGSKKIVVQNNKSKMIYV